MKADQEKKLFNAIAKCKAAINTGYQGIEAALMKRDIENDKLKKDSKKYTKDGMYEAHSKIVEQFNNDITAAVDTCKGVIAEQKAAYMAVVNEYYRPDGAKIDSDDMALLNSGIILQNDEIFDMIKKHRDNVTMLRVIGQYATEHKIITKIPAELGVVLKKATTGGNSEEKAFDRFIHFAAMGFEHPCESYTHFMQRLDDYEAEAVIAIKKATLYIDADVQDKIDELVHAQYEKNNDTRKHLDPGHLHNGVVIY